MVSLASIIPSLHLGEWYATLYLKDAYFHISISVGTGDSSSLWWVNAITSSQH